MRLLLSAIFGLCVLATPAIAWDCPVLRDAALPKRIALVIGNGAYNNMPLPNPKNDAEDVGDSLAALGFTTIVCIDLTYDYMRTAINEFAEKAKNAEVAIVYYAGHGMQIDGRNYLWPIDVKTQSATYKLLPVDSIIASLNNGPRVRLLVLDACRNNPREDELRRRFTPRSRGEAATTRGLAPIPEPSGLLVAYSTQSGKIAADGDGRNSPFTAAFLRHVGRADVDLRDVLMAVGDDVFRETGEQQEPELKISAYGKVKLKVTTQLEATQPVFAAAPTVSAPSHLLNMIHPEAVSDVTTQLETNRVTADNSKANDLASKNVVDFAPTNVGWTLTKFYIDPCDDEFHRAYLRLLGRRECEPRFILVYPSGGLDWLNGNPKGFGVAEPRLNYKF